LKNITNFKHEFICSYLSYLVQFSLQIISFSKYQMVINEGIYGIKNEASLTKYNRRNQLTWNIFQCIMKNGQLMCKIKCDAQIFSLSNFHQFRIDSTNFNYSWKVNTKNVMHWKKLYVFFVTHCKRFHRKNVFYGKMKMTTKKIVVLESFVIVGSFNCDHNRIYFWKIGLGVHFLKNQNQLNLSFR
jgi:hypothetical protein